MHPCRRNSRQDVARLLCNLDRDFRFRGRQANSKDSLLYGIKLCGPGPFSSCLGVLEMEQVANLAGEVPVGQFLRK